MRSTLRVTVGLVLRVLAVGSTLGSNDKKGTILLEEKFREDYVPQDSGDVV